MQEIGAVPRPLARPVALAGLVLFGIALIFFVYQYAVTFGLIIPGPSSPRAVAVDIALFSAFALHHSLFARDKIRKLITRTVGSLERSVYVWIASAMFIAVCFLWRPVGGTLWQVTKPALAGGMTAIQLVGIWLSLRSAFAIDVRELSGLAQLDAPSTTRNASEYELRGPYAWVRHPIYAGWFLIVFATPTMTLTRFVFAVTSGLYLLIAIPLEERTLRRSSGGAYDAYMRKVPWKLVPRLYCGLLPLGILELIVLR